MTKKSSLTDEFVAKAEEKILRGEWKVGQKLPTLRELSQDMGVSRSVINAGIVELIARGYLETLPRKWTVVNDWKRQGTLAVLNGIIKNNTWDEEVLRSLFDSRMLIECEAAAGAALNHDDNTLTAIKHCINYEQANLNGEISEKALNDIKFHHAIAVASGNIVYPLILKSFEQSTYKFVLRFYSDDRNYMYVRDMHLKIYEAIKSRDRKLSQELMRQLLVHGENNTILSQEV